MIINKSAVYPNGETMTSIINEVINLDTLKKLFPFSFGEKDLANLILTIILYAVINAAAGALIKGFSWVPILSVPFILIGSLAGIYATAGIIIAILVYEKAVKICQRPKRRYLSSFFGRFGCASEKEGLCTTARKGRQVYI